MLWVWRSERRHLNDIEKSPDPWISTSAVGHESFGDTDYGRIRRVVHERLTALLHDLARHRFNSVERRRCMSVHRIASDAAFSPRRHLVGSNAAAGSDFRHVNGDGWFNQYREARVAGAVRER
jgi:hypothetical protein